MAKPCTHQGSVARLSCATCGEQICSRCLVETRVGFKCQEHGRLAAATTAPKPVGGGPAGSAKGPKPAKPPRRGGFGLMAIIGLFVVIPMMTVGLGFLFAATGNDTGFVSVLPLLGFFLLLAVVTTLAIRKLVR